MPLPTYVSTDTLDRADALDLNDQAEEGISSIRLPHLVEQGIRSIRQAAFGSPTATTWTPTKPPDPLPVVLTQSPQPLAYSPTVTSADIERRDSRGGTGQGFSADSALSQRPSAYSGAPSAMSSGGSGAAPQGGALGEIDNSSREAFVRTAYPHALQAADGDPKLAQQLLATAISENGKVGTGQSLGEMGFNVGGIQGVKGTAGSFTALDAGRPREFAAYNTLGEGFRAVREFVSGGRYAPAAATYRQTGDIDRYWKEVNEAGYSETPDWQDRIAAIRRSQVEPITAGLSAGAPTAAAPPAAGSPSSPPAAESSRSAAGAYTQQGLADAGDPDAWAKCGPVAAYQFAQKMGRNPTPTEVEKLARDAGWTPARGMAGFQSEAAVLKGMNIAARAEDGVDWDRVITDVSRGNPVILQLPGNEGHYITAQGYDPQTGKIDFGSTVGDLRAAGHRTQFTPRELEGLGWGTPNASLYVDNPATPAPSVAAGGSSYKLSDTLPPDEGGPSAGDQKRQKMAAASGQPAAMPDGSAPLDWQLPQGQPPVLQNQQTQVPYDPATQNVTDPTPNGQWYRQPLANMGPDTTTGQEYDPRDADQGAHELQNNNIDPNVSPESSNPLTVGSGGTAPSPADDPGGAQFAAQDAYSAPAQPSRYDPYGGSSDPTADATRSVQPDTAPTSPTSTQVPVWDDSGQVIGYRQAPAPEQRQNQQRQADGYGQVSSTPAEPDYVPSPPNRVEAATAPAAGVYGHAIEDVNRQEDAVQQRQESHITSEIGRQILAPMEAITRGVRVATAIVQATPEATAETVNAALGAIGLGRETYGVDTPLGRVGIGDAALALAPNEKIQAVMTAGAPIAHGRAGGTDILERGANAAVGAARDLFQSAGRGIRGAISANAERVAAPGEMQLGSGFVPQGNPYDVQNITRAHVVEQHPNYPSGTPEAGVNSIMRQAAAEAPDQLAHVSGDEIALTPGSPFSPTRKEETAIPGKKNSGTAPIPLNPGGFPSTDDVRAAVEVGLPHKDWYFQIAERAAQLVGEENLPEFFTIFGITSAQTKVHDNIAATAQVMRSVREMQAQGKTWPEIRAALLDAGDQVQSTFKGGPKAGQGRIDNKGKPVMEYTRRPEIPFVLSSKDKRQAIVDAYETGISRVESGAKTSSYAGSFESAGQRVYDPRTTNDLWVWRAFNVTPDGIKSAANDDAAYRVVEAVLNEIAAETGLPGHNVQAAMWATMKNLWEQAPDLARDYESGAKSLSEVIAEGKARRVEVGGKSVPLFEVPTGQAQDFDRPEVQRVLSGADPALLRSPGPTDQAASMTRQYSGQGAVPRPSNLPFRLQERAVAEGQAPIATIGATPQEMDTVGLDRERGVFPWLTIPHRVVESGGEASIHLPGGNSDTARYVGSLIGERLGRPATVSAPVHGVDSLAGVAVSAPPRLIKALSEGLQEAGVPHAAGTTGTVLQIPHNGGDADAFLGTIQEVAARVGVPPGSLRLLTGEVSHATPADHAGIVAALQDRYRASIPSGVQGGPGRDIRTPATGSGAEGSGSSPQVGSGAVPSISPGVRAAAYNAAQGGVLGAYGADVQAQEQGRESATPGERLVGAAGGAGLAMVAGNRGARAAVSHALGSGFVPRGVAGNLEARIASAEARFTSARQALDAASAAMEQRGLSAAEFNAARRAYTPIRREYDVAGNALEALHEQSRQINSKIDSAGYGRPLADAGEQTSATAREATSPYPGQSAGPIPRTVDDTPRTYSLGSGFVPAEEPLPSGLGNVPPSQINQGALPGMNPLQQSPPTPIGQAAQQIAANLPPRVQRAVQAGQTQAAQLAAAGKPSIGPLEWTRRLGAEIGYSSMIGPATFSVNVMGNLMEPLYAIPKEAARSVARTGGLGEFAQMAGGAFHGMGQLGTAIVDALASRGKYAPTPGHEPLSAVTTNPIGRAIATGLEAGGRVFSALPDAVFGTIAQGAGEARAAAQMATDAGLKGPAWKQHVSDLLHDVEAVKAGGLPSVSGTQDVIDAGGKYAKRQTFQDELGTYGKKARSFARVGDMPVIGNLMAPFFNTPWNMGLRLGERTPVGFAMNSQGSKFDKMYDATLGSALLIGLAAGPVASGMVTGGGPDDPQKKSEMRSQGWRPYSTLIDGVYVPNRVMGIYGPLLNAAADVHDSIVYAKDKSAGSIASNYVGRVGQQLQQQPYLQGISTLMQAIQAGQGGGLGSAAERYASGTLTRMVPYASTARTIGTMQDPLERTTDQGKNVPASTTIAQQVRSGIGNRQGFESLGQQPLPAAQDVLGREQANPQQGAGALFAKTSSTKPDPVVQTFLDASVDIPYPHTKVTIGGAPIDLTETEQRRWNEVRGEMLTRLVAPLAANGALARMPSSTREQMLKSYLDMAAQQADTRVFAEMTDRSQRIRDSIQQKNQKAAS